MGCSTDILFLVETTTALLADSIFREHLAGREHPERPERSMPWCGVCGRQACSNGWRT